MSFESAGIEVGRLALRTFKVDKLHRALLPVNAASASPRLADWRDGTCVARCQHGRPHAAPADECSCGIYGTLNLVSLTSQYPLLTSNIIAVIAAEGPTIIGNEGLRTQAARVVGYWCDNSGRLDDAREVLAEQCAGAISFDDLGTMLASFGIPRVPSTGKINVRHEILRRATPRILATAATYGVLTRLSGILGHLAAPMLITCLVTQFVSVLPPLTEFIITLLGSGAAWSLAYLVVRRRDKNK